MISGNSFRQRIDKELELARAEAKGDLLAWIAAGQGQKAVDALVFFTSPQALREKWSRVGRQIDELFPACASEQRGYCLQFLANLALALSFFMPRWNLQDRGRHGDAALGESSIGEVAAEAVSQLTRLSGEASDATQDLIRRWQHTHRVRLVSEGVEPDEASQLATAMVGQSPRDYLQNLRREVDSSNLYRIALMRSSAETVTELGNDYAASLPYAMHLGTSFVTSNPPLVDLAWVGDPDFWNPVVDRIIAANGDADDDMLARHVTLEVVWANMRLLRPIFLLTGGGMGYVSLQVNPKKHYDADSMISDLLSIHQDLQDRLDGGPPNVVFKLPATRAGLDACREAVARGIGVNVTVSFGLFQELPFAEALAQGNAPVSYLTVFNGRLASQVRDELLRKLEDGEHGLRIGPSEVKRAAAWAGVAIVNRLHRLLTERGYDLSRIRPLVASLRFYAREDYPGLPTSCPDVTESLGVSVISVLPQVRRSFDSLHGLMLDGRKVESPVPPDVLDVLMHSEIFRQAYWVGDEEWLAEEDQRFRPASPLTLEDEYGAASWTPVKEVLGDFIHAYERFVERIRGRKYLLTLREQAGSCKTQENVT